MELVQVLTNASNDYREMSQGHQGLGGFCIALSNRLARLRAKLETPEQTPQIAADGPARIPGVADDTEALA